ncbi:MAG: prepilin-type N-terminal cleavage/methylation domain-containing protein [Lachnospiraceae bacterium]|nr:prepilin-type N-terminal cleavage/methylation domain-containing protein [Lachnospiraceae bacterium]
MKQRKKKIEHDLCSDSGFSLVELVVVVLIMAIIAVALAPQVLKWVNNSRIATDMDLQDSLQGFVQVTVLGNEAANVVAVNNGAALVADNSGTQLLKLKDDGTPDYGNPYTDSGSEKPLYDKFREVSGAADLSKMKTKIKGAKVIVKVSKDSTRITAEYIAADGSSIEMED